MRVSLLRKFQVFFLFFGIVIISGVLQRPIGGQVIEGSMSDAVTVESNQLMTYIGLLFYGWSGVMFLRFWPRTKPFSETYALCLLVVLAVASVLWSQDPALSLVRALGLIGCTLFALAIFACFRLDEIVRYTTIFFVFFIFGTFLLMLVLPSYALHGGDEFYSIHSGLLRGSYNHKNSFARVLSLGLIFLVFFPLKGLYWRYAGYFALIVGFFLLLQTGSAKTFVSVPAAIFAGYIFVFLRSFSLRIAAILAFVLLLLVLYSSGFISIFEAYLLEGLDRDPNMSARTFIWAVATDEALKTPFLGSGYGGAGWRGDGIGASMISIIGFDPGHAHNGFIQTFVELGAVGFLLAVYFIIFSCYRLLKIKSTRDGGYLKFFVAWMVLFGFNNYAGSFMVQPNDIYWYMLLVLCLYLYSVRVRRI